MPIVNPNDKKYGDSAKVEPCGDGTHVFVALGFEHFDINGKPVVEVRSVCIQSPNGQEGKELRDLFFLHSDKAMSRFIAFTRDGLGNKEPFDPNSEDDVARIIGLRPFTATVKLTYDGQYAKQETGWAFKAPVLSIDPATGAYVLTQPQMDIINKGRKLWAGYCKWRFDNPRDGVKKKSGGGDSSSGPHGGSGDGATDLYGDIPF